MNICVLGNSHVGAVKMAHDAAPPTISGNRVDFHAVHAGMLAVENGMVVARPAKSLSSTCGPELDPAAYDAILVSAVGQWAFRNENPRHILRHMALANWGGSLPLVSRTVFSRSLRQSLVDFPLAKLCAELARVCTGKLVFQPWPLPARAVLADPNWHFNRVYGKRAPEVVAYYYQAQYEVLEELVGDRGV